MADLKDVKAGDRILVPHSTGGFSSKIFLLPKEVVRTTKTQVIVMSQYGKEVRFKRESGYEIGQASMSHINKYAKPYLECDDESELLTKWEERQDAERAIYKALQFLKVPKLDDDQLSRLNDLLVSFKGSD